MALITGGGNELTKTPAAKAAAQIHVLDKAEEFALRIKDAGALEKALVGKLESQRSFATEYSSKFPHGGDRREQDDRDVILPQATEWCLSYGFHIRTVQRWLDLLDPAIFTEKKNAILDRCWKLAELWQAANYSSASIEWYTPARYLEAVREVLGKIDLDPASNEQANGTIRAAKFFTQADDGLKLDWFGRVFMNPPYGSTPEYPSLAAAFCNKAISQYQDGKIDAAIILVNSSHSQAWQAPLYDFPICFVDHRIQFVAGDGEKNKNPTFQNIFVYLGPNTPKFCRAFSRFGYVMQRVVA